MTMWFQTALVLVAAAAPGIAAETENDDDEVKIVNGTEVTPGEFPFQVSLEYQGSHICGASILNESWILSAAHCVHLKTALPSLFTVLAGVVDLQDPNGQRRKVSRIIVHEKYLRQKYLYDIAVIQLESPLVYSDYVQPVNLPTAEGDTPPGAEALSVGWGFSSSEKQTVMRRLQMVDLVILSDQECSDALLGKPNRTTVCAGAPGGHRGVCSGDSGGPLLVNGSQVGITAFSLMPCGSAPAAYTEVSWFLAWIRETQESASNSWGQSVLACVLQPSLKDCRPWFVGDAEDMDAIMYA